MWILRQFLFSVAANLLLTIALVGPFTFISPFGGLLLGSASLLKSTAVAIYVLECILATLTAYAFYRRRIPRDDAVRRTLVFGIVFPSAGYLSLLLILGAGVLLLFRTNS
jgi:hypothetical protein